MGRLVQQEWKTAYEIYFSQVKDVLALCLLLIFKSFLRCRDMWSPTETSGCVSPRDPTLSRAEKCEFHVPEVLVVCAQSENYGDVLHLSPRCNGSAQMLVGSILIPIYKREEKPCPTLCGLYHQFFFEHHCEPSNKKRRWSLPLKRKQELHLLSHLIPVVTLHSSDSVPSTVFIFFRNRKHTPGYLPFRHSSDIKVPLLSTPLGFIKQWSARYAAQPVSECGPPLWISLYV